MKEKKEKKKKEEEEHQILRKKVAIIFKFKLNILATFFLKIKTHQITNKKIRTHPPKKKKKKKKKKDGRHVFGHHLWSSVEVQEPKGETKKKRKEHSSLPIKRKRKLKQSVNTKKGGHKRDIDHFF